MAESVGRTGKIVFEDYEVRSKPYWYWFGLVQAELLDSTEGGLLLRPRSMWPCWTLWLPT